MDEQIHQTKPNQPDTVKSVSAHLAVLALATDLIYCVSSLAFSSFFMSISSLASMKTYFLQDQLS